MPSLFTNRRLGTSLAPFDSLNFALHVGDDQSHVERNRGLLELHTPPVQFMNQVHGGSFAVIAEKSSIDPTCDALITTKPGLALAVMSADCIPLLLSASGVVASVHVGRKGLTNHVATNVIQAMRALGAITIHAELGPSICGSCYEVSQTVADEVLTSHPRAFASTSVGKPALDLPKALIGDLVELGVTYEASSICTLENIDYFSYRRNNITGRNAGVIWL